MRKWILKLAVKHAGRELLSPRTSEFWTVIVGGVLRVMTALVGPELMDESTVQAIERILEVMMIAGGTRITSKLAKGGKD
jgi:hypothetical protein